MTKFYFFCPSEQYQPEEIIKQAIAVEEAGFDGLMISEHFHPWVDDYSSAGFAFATLGAIAVVTKNLELMTAVTTPLFRFHPAIIAQAAATIDRLSNGRFSLGIGTGENINEKPLGYSLPPYKERAARLSEAGQIIRRLLDGEKLTFDGHFYQTLDAKLYSPPIHRLPILMAAGGPQSASLAGRQFDGLIVSAKNVKETKINAVRPALKLAKDKEFILVANRWTVYDPDGKSAWTSLLSQRGLRSPGRNEAHDPQSLREEADKIGRAEILGNFETVTCAADYIKAYQPLIKDLRADIVGIQTASLEQLATIKMLGQEVLPELRKGESA